MGASLEVVGSVSNPGILAAMTESLECASMSRVPLPSIASTPQTENSHSLPFFGVFQFCVVSVVFHQGVYRTSVSVTVLAVGTARAAVVPPVEPRRHSDLVEIFAARERSQDRRHVQRIASVGPAISSNGCQRVTELFRSRSPVVPADSLLYQ